MSRFSIIFRTSLENWVSRTLRWGVAASCLMLVIGLTFVFVQNQPRPEGTPDRLSHLVQKVAIGDGTSWLQLGLLLLMLTPVARVLVLFCGWTTERRWRLAAVALIVLLTLACSTWLGTG